MKEELELLALSSLCHRNGTIYNNVLQSVSLKAYCLLKVLPEEELNMIGNLG